jgi:hypothetical protein
VFSAGTRIGHRTYDEISNSGNEDGHFTYGFNIEANLKLYKHFYTAIGFEESFYSEDGGNSITGFYLQPSIATNLFNGSSTIFGGVRGDLLIDGRFWGYGIEPFVRLQYNFLSNVCVGYHFGIQRFQGDRVRIGGSPAGLPPPAEFDGFNFISYLYIGLRLNK